MGICFHFDWIVARGRSLFCHLLKTIIMSRKHGYEMFKPNARSSSRCTYLWIFLIFTLVFTAYRYGVWNYDFGESVKMVSLPKQTENVQHVNRPSGDNLAERVEILSGERPLKFKSRNGEPDKESINSKPSEDDERPSRLEKVESFKRNHSPRLSQARQNIANSPRVSSPERSRLNRESQSKNIPNNGKTSENSSISAWSSVVSSSGDSDSVSTQIVRSPGGQTSNQSVNSSDSGSSESYSKNSNESITNSKGSEKVASLNETGIHLNTSAPEALPNFKSDSPADNDKSTLDSNQKETPQQASNLNQSVNQQQPVNSFTSNTISAQNSARVASPELHSEQRSNLNIPRQPLLPMKLKGNASNDNDKANS